MCKKLTVAYGDYIGRRMVGWAVFNGKDYSFLSDKQIKAKLQQGDLVNGLKLDADGNVAIDTEFTKTLMGKSGLTFNPITSAEDEEDEPVMNKYYALVKVVKGGGGKGNSKSGTEYHFITNRCGYEIFSEQQVKAMLEVLALGGVKLGERGEVVIHGGVEVEGEDKGQSKPKESTKAGEKAGEKAEEKPQEVVE